MESAGNRACLGLVAGAIAVLTFHQGMVEAFNVLGLAPLGAFRTAPTPPFGVPVIVNLTFWGGIYGMLFALLMPRFRRPLWLFGILLGLIVALIGMFVAAPIKGNAIAFGWAAWPIVRSLLVNAFWGLGVACILPVLAPRPLGQNLVRVSRA